MAVTWENERGAKVSGSGKYDIMRVTDIRDREEIGREKEARNVGERHRERQTDRGTPLCI